MAARADETGGLNRLEGARAVSVSKSDDPRDEFEHMGLRCGGGEGSRGLTKERMSRMTDDWVWLGRRSPDWR
jgi:hypothetical protein